MVANMESNTHPEEATQIEEHPFSMEVLCGITGKGDTLVIDMADGTPQSLVIHRCDKTGQVEIMIHNACEGDQVTIFHGQYNELYQPLNNREKEGTPLKYRKVATTFRVQGRC